MKSTGILILLVIICSLIPVYSLYKYLPKWIRPKDSAERLILYLVTGLMIIFVYTFLLVLLIKALFPAA